MSQLIKREEALAHCELFAESTCRILIIQAQAGQGKTVLATQFDESSAATFAWVTCTPSRQTPRLLFDRIQESVAAVFPELPAETMQEAAMQQLVDTEYIEIMTGLFGAALEEFNQPLYLVFDDVHLLDGSPLAVQMLRQLVERTPSLIRFVFISRYPMALNGEPLFSPSTVMQIDKSLLAFSREEIAILFNDVLGEPTGTRKIKQLFDATEGWISGLKLLHASGGIQRLVQAETSSLGAYFDELILPSLSPDEYQEVTKLALLEELPEDLLVAHAPPYLVKWIKSLVSKNCFIRSSREDAGVFHLHHIFQEYLVSQAETMLTEEQRTEFLTSVGNWCLENNRVKEGLRYFAKAKNWLAVESAMEQHCLTLLSLNHHHLLMDILDSIPIRVVYASAWLCFAHGATRLLLAPAQCEEALARSAALFKDNDNQFGELLACCSLLNFNVLVSGEFGRKAALVERAAALFDGQYESLPSPIVATCAQAIALGRAYYESKLEDAIHYHGIASSVAGGTGVDQTWGMITKVLILGLKGELETALDELSSSFRLTNLHWLSPTTKFSLLIVEVNFLLMAGRMREYRLLCDEIRRDWAEFLQQSYLGAFLLVWDLDLMLSEGHYPQMVHESRRYLADNPDLPAHMYCQFKHYEMIALAHLNEFEEMDSAMKSALRYRAKGGGPYFMHLTHSLVAGALSMVGRQTSAWRVFHKCFPEQQDAMLVFHDPLAYSYLAAMLLKNGEYDRAKELIQTMLNIMKGASVKHFFGWSADIMSLILSYAVQVDIHAEYARSLALSRLQADILDDGTIIPLLHVGILGDITLSHSGRTLSGCEVTQTWRQVFTLLALSPNHEMAIRDIQTTLWPDAEPEDSRGKFDTMLSRLRSRLSKKLGRDVAKLHLQVKSQRLALKHCLFDSDRLKHYAMEGIAYANKKSLWQAHNAFECMGYWLRKVSDQPLSGGVPQAMVPLVTRAYGCWLQVLDRSEAPHKALPVVEAAISYDPINDDFHRQRYNLLTVLKRPAEAVMALRDYRKILLEHDFSQEDVTQIVDSLLGEN